MKHKKLSISIVSAFIAALGLTACSNVTADDKAIVSLKGYDGGDLSVITDTIYDKYKVSEDGLTSFYQAILEVMIRDHFESEKADAQTKADFKKFDESAKNDVLADKEKARDNSETNKTSYDVEWKAILDASNVKNEEELYQKHLYDYEKEAYQDSFFEDNKASLTSEYIGYMDDLTSVDANGTSMYPYHIRHILVKTTADAKNYVTSEITASEAQKLATVYEALTNGKNDFGSVAKQLSEDGSAKDFGDAGIMTTATSFVNEFKLGIYAYDIVYGKTVTGDVTSAGENLKDGKAVNHKLGLDGEYNENSSVSVKDKLDEIGLGTVSYEVFDFLGDEYKTETDKDGYKVNDGLAKSFPRNIFWNNYLNMHNVFVITDEPLEAGVHQDKYAKPEAAVAGKTGFRTVAGLTDAIGAGKKVLTDEDGRVIVGVRSEFGIHFMIMERTPFEVKGNEKMATINEYYTTLKPGDDGFPTKPTYVNHLNAVDASVYAQRAKTVKEEIKGFDKMYDYRMFEELVNSGKVEIHDEIVSKEIFNYINNKRANNIWSIEKELNASWNSYLDMISLQNEVRKPEAKRMVKPTCAIKFNNRNDAAFDKITGDCYYEA